MRGTTASFAGMRGSGGLGLMKSSSGLGASSVRNDLQFRGQSMFSIIIITIIIISRTHLLFLAKPFDTPLGPNPNSNI